MINYLRNLTPNRAVFLLISVCLTSFYLQKIYFEDLNGFIFKTAGPIFLGLATLAGLSFSYAGVVKSKEARSTAIFTGEKLFHASAHILVAAMLGICAIEIPIQQFSILYLFISPWQIFLILLKAALVIAGFNYVLNTFYDARIGFEDLFELLSERKAERLRIINEKNKTPESESLPAPSTKESVSNEEEQIKLPIEEQVSQN